MVPSCPPCRGCGLNSICAWPPLRQSRITTPAPIIIPSTIANVRAIHTDISPAYAAGMVNTAAIAPTENSMLPSLWIRFAEWLLVCLSIVFPHSTSIPVISLNIFLSKLGIDLIIFFLASDNPFHQIPGDLT